MKLYYNPISNNCRRVLAAIYESGRDDIELELVDLMQGGHKTPEYLAINPNGKVPTLVDGDTNLWESTAIMQYISSDSPLWPANKTRYDIIRWQCWDIAHFGPGFSKVVGERVLKKAFGGGEPNEAVVTEGLEAITRFGTVLDAHLEGRDWLVGDSITLADLSVAAHVALAEVAQIDLTPFPNVSRWYKQIEARDSWKRSAPE